MKAHASVTANRLSLGKMPSVPVESIPKLMQLRLEACNALNLIMLGGVSGSYTNNKNFGTVRGIGSRLVFCRSTC